MSNDSRAVNAALRRKRKTYGINGLTEITMAIPVGKAWMNIHFTGGAITGYGVIPATFTTDNPGVQKLIEVSPAFRDGRIRVVRS